MVKGTEKGEKMRTLNTLQVGECARVTYLEAEGGLRRRFQDLGLICGTKIKCTGQSTKKDICAYLIKGAVIAIRKEDAKKVHIKCDGTK